MDGAESIAPADEPVDEAESALIAHLRGPAHEDEFGLRAGVVPLVRCVDGFTISVQASRFHRCSPKSDEGPWTEVEVADPSVPEPTLLPYIEGRPSQEPTQAVYNYVPIATVEAIIARHGGMVPAAGDRP